MTRTTSTTGIADRPTWRIRFTAWAVVAWCLGFAAVNAAFTVAGKFADGPYAEYAIALSIMNWVAFALKILGAAVAVLTITNWPRWIPDALRTMFVWAAFSLLALYSAGSVVQFGQLLTSASDQITVGSVAYLAFFVAGAVGYGTLAVSFSRRSRSARRYILIGAVGGPLVLGLMLVAAPAALGALGMLAGPQ